MKWIKEKAWQGVQSWDYYGSMGRIWLIPNYSTRIKVNRHARKKGAK